MSQWRQFFRKVTRDRNRVGQQDRQIDVLSFLNGGNQYRDYNYLLVSSCEHALLPKRDVLRHRMLVHPSRYGVLVPWLALSEGWGYLVCFNGFTITISVTMPTACLRECIFRHSAISSGQMKICGQPLTPADQRGTLTLLEAAAIGEAFILPPIDLSRQIRFQ